MFYEFVRQLLGEMDSGAAVGRIFYGDRVMYEVNYDLPFAV